MCLHEPGVTGERVGSSPAPTNAKEVSRRGLFRNQGIHTIYNLLFERSGYHSITCIKNANRLWLRVASLRPPIALPALHWNWNVWTRKTAIWPRVVGSFGQKLPPPQPAAMPRLASSLIHGANPLEQGTSAKRGVVQGGGV